MPWKFVIKSYVDDIFGGASTKEQTRELKNEIIATGLLTTAIPNLEKCHGPSQQLTILGTMFDALKRTVTLPPKKTTKILSSDHQLVKEGARNFKRARTIGWLFSLSQLHRAIWQTFYFSYFRKNLTPDPKADCIHNRISQMGPLHMAFDN